MSRCADRYTTVSAEFALDFGTGSTRIADASGALLVDEPTVAAVDKDTGRVVAFGSEVLGLGARAAGRVAVRFPVRNGQLVDLDLVEEVLAEALRRAGASRLSHPRVLVCTHVGATRVQNRALDRAVRRAGAKDVLFIAHPTACAIGAGIAIDEPTGSMVVDVGAGTTDVAVFALGGIVVSSSCARGGDDLDEAVRVYLVRQRDILVDREAVEAARLALATAAPRPRNSEFEVVGRDARSGRPTSAVLTSVELRPILEPLLAPMFDAAVRGITEAPPELVNDLIGSGLLLAGGVGQLDGFDRRLARLTGVPVRVAADAGRCAVLGAARCLELPDGLSYAVSVSRIR
ncbi:MAG: rod shape-determining protein [Acidimicrobiales bacterium]